MFTATDDVVLLHRNLIVQMMTAGCIALLGGHTESQFVGRSMRDFLPDESMDQVNEYGRRRNAGEYVPPSYTLRLRGIDGGSINCEVRSTVVIVDGALHMLIRLRGIEAQHRAIEASRETNDFYRSIFTENGAIKLLIEPSNGAIIDANPAAEEYYGYSLGELRQMFIGDINTQSPEELLSNLQRARGGAQRQFLFRHRTKRGIRDVEVSSGIVVLNGETRLLSIIFDVTDRIALEAQVRQSQRMDAIGRMAAGLAHDFKNLITVLHGTTSLLSRAAENPARVRALVNDLETAAARGARVVQQLGAVGQQSDAAMQRVGVEAWLRKTMEFVRPAITTQVEVTSEFAPDLLDVHTDPEMLEQVIVNLVINAHQAITSAGQMHGVIAIRARVTESPPSELPDGQYVEIAIADTGPGIGADVMPHLFEPFYTTKAHGSGLGLASAYGLVRKLGGAIVVQNNADVGATFSIFVPAI